VRRHVKASSAGSIVPSGKRRLWSLLATLALALCALGSGASFASAAITPTTGSVSEVLSGSAHVTGAVDTGEASSANYHFEYSTDKVGWVEAGGGSLSGDGTHPVSLDITGLKGATKYFVRLSAGPPFEEAVFSPEPYLEFETLPANPPVVLSIDDASSVQGTVAKASGEVQRPTPGNPDPGFDANCNFQYVSDAEYIANGNNDVSGFTGAAQAGCNHNPVKAADSPQVSAILTGLNPSTSYHLRLVASNAGGSDAKVAADTFTTLAIPKPTVSLNPIANLTATGATFSAKIDPGAAHSDDPGFAVHWHFECQPACLDLSRQSGSFADDGVEHEVKTDAALEPNTPYTIKVVAENFSGSESDEDTFHTSKGVPTALTVPAFALEGGTSALLGARINPNKSPSTYWFEWGTSDCSANPCQETSHLPANANEVQGLSVVATAGTFNITFRGRTTADLPYNVSAEGLRTALEGLSTIGTGNVLVSLSAGSYRITFIGDLAGAALPETSASSGTTPLENGVNEASATVKTITDGGFYTDELAGLAPSSIYHFRVSVENSSGQVHGEDRTFKTSTPPGPPASCPNAAFRTGPSANLPDCRAYENVTPLNLLGSKAEATGTVAENGEAVIWRTFASLPGFESIGLRDYYLAKRTSSGWSSVMVSPPGRMMNMGDSASETVFTTPNLDGPIIWDVKGAINPESPDPTGPATQYHDLYRRELDGSFTWLDRGSDMVSAGSDYVTFLGASPDGLKVFFTNQSRRLEPDAPNGGLYVRSGETTTVVKDENGIPVPISWSLLRGFGISDDGSVLAFVVNAVSAGEELYVYDQDLGHSVHVTSAPFSQVGLISLSSDGSKLFFSTTEDLTSDDVDHGSDPFSVPADIYEYEVSTGDLRRLSGTVAGPGPGNGKASATPVLASPDGSAVYFTSTEQLDGSKGLNRTTNLYRAEGGEIHYALTLPNGGPVQSPNSGQSPQITLDGKTLLFTSSDRLTAYDNAGHREIYAYDSVSGRTICASCRPNGEAPSGDAILNEKRSADRHGERIFFQSNDEVLPQDINGKADVYEFDATSNTTSLISTGESPAPALLGSNSADGRDVFFTSADSLRPNDQNVGAPKLFDARIGGGFPEPPPPPACEGEGCRGAASTKPADVAPATPSFAGPGNQKPKKPKKKPRKHKHKSHKKHQSKSHKRATNSNGRTGR
jgi:Tol biopolymer transport system component